MIPFRLLPLLCGLSLAALSATAQDIPGPPGSGAFGATVTTLPNGNFVVCDSNYDLGAVSDVGAVYTCTTAPLWP